MLWEFLTKEEIVLFVLFKAPLKKVKVLETLDVWVI